LATYIALLRLIFFIVLRLKQKTQRYFSFIGFFIGVGQTLTASGDFGVTTKLLCL